MNAVTELNGRIGSGVCLQLVQAGPLQHLYNAMVAMVMAFLGGLGVTVWWILADIKACEVLARNGIHIAIGLKTVNSCTCKDQLFQIRKALPWASKVRAHAPSGVHIRPPYRQGYLC